MIPGTENREGNMILAELRNVNKNLQVHCDCRGFLADSTGQTATTYHINLSRWQASRDFEVRYGKIPREFRGATLADDFVAFFASSLERVSESATTRRYPKLQLYGATQQHIKSMNQEVREAVRYKMSW
jgi:hypothetical protein